MKRVEFNACSSHNLRESDNNKNNNNNNKLCTKGYIFKYIYVYG